MPNSEKTPNNIPGSNINENLDVEIARQRAINLARGKKVSAAAFEELIREEEALKQKINEDEEYLKTLLTQREKLNLDTSKVKSHEKEADKRIDSFVKSIRESVMASRKTDDNPNSIKWNDPRLEEMFKGQNSESKVSAKAKKNSNFKRALSRVVAASLVPLAALNLISGNKQVENPKAPEKPAIKDDENKSVVDGAEDIYLSNGDVATFTQEEQNAPTTSAETEVNKEYCQGLIDGYDKDGMWLSERKPHKVAFASAEELAEKFNNDETEMVKATAAYQVESFAAYIACLPDELKPDQLKGLDMKSIDDLLEHDTSDSDYRAYQKWFNSLMDDAFTRHPVINGHFDNVYMKLGNGSDPVNHENMQLVQCATNEYNLEVTEFYWQDKDGKEIGSLMVKMAPVRDADGNITGYKLCMQPLVPAGSQIIGDLPPVEPPVEPPVGPPTPPPVPPIIIPEDPEPKDPENLERIDEQIEEDIAEDIGTGEVVVEPVSPVSEDDLTDKPTGDDHEGTEPTIVQSEPSQEATPVSPVNPENDYSEDRGGAHDDEYAPVKPDEAAQQAADVAEIPINEAPGADDLEDILAEFGY